MKSSDSLKELYGALAKALGALKNPALDSNNPFFKSKYASLAGVRDRVTPTLAEHGVAVIQDLLTVEHGVCCTTRFIHTSGEWTETEGFTVPVSKGDAQGTVATSTYARRISLMAACNVVGDVDDDGNEAAAHPPKPAAPKTKPQAPAPAAPPTDPLIDRFEPTPAYADGTAAIARINACTTIDQLTALGEAMKAEKLKFSPEEAPMVKEAGQQRRDKLLSTAIADGIARQPPLPRDAAIATCNAMMAKLGPARWAAMVDGCGGDHKDKVWHQNLGLAAMQALAAQMQEAAKK